MKLIYTITVIEDSPDLESYEADTPEEMLANAQAWAEDDSLDVFGLLGSYPSTIIVTLEQ